MPMGALIACLQLFSRLWGDAEKTIEERFSLIKPRWSSNTEVLP